MLKSIFSGRNIIALVRGSNKLRNYSSNNASPSATKLSALIQQQSVGLNHCFQRYFSAENNGDGNPEENENFDSNSVEKYPLSVTEVIQKDYLSIDEVVDFLKEDFCEDLCVIKVDPNRIKFHYVDYFVVVSGRSVRHLKSMAFGLCSKFKKKVREQRGKATAVVEGEDCLDWMAVDIGNIVVHFMMPEAREKYELEKLWTLGPELDDQYQAMLKADEEAPVFQFKTDEQKKRSSDDEINGFSFEESSETTS